MIRKMLQILAALLAVVVIAGWLVAGANKGWTKTSVPVQRTDEITGITVDEYQKRFVPGLEILGAGLFLAAVLAGGSFLFGAKKLNTEKNEIKKQAS